MAWVKHTIDLDPITVEVHKRVDTFGKDGMRNGHTTKKIGEDSVRVRITIDTGKIRTLAKRAANAKTGKASIHFGAIVATVLDRKATDRLPDF